MDNPGRLLKQLLAVKGLKPTDIERRSRSLAEQRGNARFYVSHATLAEIEAGSVPGLHKVVSLAACCEVSCEQIFSIFGIETQRAKPVTSAAGGIKNNPDLFAVGKGPFRFPINFDFREARSETCLLRKELDDWESTPGSPVDRLQPRRFLYALIGLNDDRLAEIIPPGSVVGIDTKQTQVVHEGWQTIRERPVYVIWHERGYSCGWCQVNANHLLLVPDPRSRRPILQFRTPSEATVIGRITHVWCDLNAGYRSKLR